MPGDLSEGLRSVLQGTAVLSLILVAALVVSLRRPLVEAHAPRRRAALTLLAGVACHGLHFAEEWATGFETQLPRALGLAPWPAGFFVAFNLAWLAIWLAAARGLERRTWIALVPAWFYAFAAVANGIAHPLLALRVGGYFPGLLTATIEAAVGLLVWGRLAQATRAR
ncbi:MAG TPA: hypothetical protein VMV46_17485 [Thermoanaerobaculia bacterium]|nr:hypothetical protein [Thermoanaerobaculia bacterium]